MHINQHGPLANHLWLFFFIDNNGFFFFYARIKWKVIPSFSLSSFSWQARKFISSMHTCQCEPLPTWMTNLHALYKPCLGLHEYFQSSQFHRFVQPSISSSKLCNSLFHNERKRSLFILIKHSDPQFSQSLTHAGSCQTNPHQTKQT